jgi:hypothetical protein
MPRLDTSVMRVLARRAVQVTVLALASACVVAQPIVTHVQRNNADCTKDYPPPGTTPSDVKEDVLPMFDVRQLTKDSLTKLRAALHEGCWPVALKTFVRNYQPALPAWVIYIDSGSKVHDGWMINGSTSSTTHNQKYVWAMVLSEHPLTGATPTAQLALSKSQRADSTAKAKALSPLKAIVDADSSAWHAAAIYADLAAARAVAAESTLKGHDTVPNIKAVLDVEKAASDAAKARSDAESKFKGDLQALEAAQAAEDAAASTRAATLLSNAIADTADFRFARRTVQHVTDPRLIAIIAGVGKALGLSPPPTTLLNDSVRTIRLEPLAKDTTDSLMAGFARFSVVDNSVVEFGISPVPGKAFPKHVPTDCPKTQPSSSGQCMTDTTRLLHIYSNLANARQNTFELGVLTGLAFGRRAATFDAQQHLVGLSASTSFAGDVIGVVNAPWWWFRVPWREGYYKASLGAFVGTNVIGGAVGDQFVAGATVGHLLGDIGISAGYNWVQEQRLVGSVTKTDHRPRYLVGIDVRF